MDTSIIADWISAVAAVAACLASVVAWRTSERMLLIERKRDAEYQRKIERAEASRVLVVGALAVNRSENEQWSIYLNNFSTEPVFDLTINSQHVDGSMQNYPLYLSCLPPGEYLVPSDLRFRWGPLISMKTSPEPIQILAKTKKSMITSVTYQDLQGDLWTMGPDERCPHRDESKS